MGVVFGPLFFFAHCGLVLPALPQIHPRYVPDVAECQDAHWALWDVSIASSSTPLNELSSTNQQSLHHRSPHRRSPELLHPAAPWAVAWRERLRQCRIVAVIHAPTTAAGLAMADAAIAGGIELLEVTLTSTQPYWLIEQLRARWPQAQVGAGTVMGLDAFQNAAAAGAQFCFSPVTEALVIERAFRRGIPFVAGALTPNEIWQAWQLGATAVKVFPIQAMGGAAYLKNLCTPMGALPLVPTGGISLDNTASLLQAGAIALCIGGSLFPRAWVEQQNWDAIAERAAAFVTEAGVLPRSSPCHRPPLPIQGSTTA